MSGNNPIYIQDDVINNIEQDTFGHKHIADAVVKSILSTTPPFTIGIFGGWGTGKSSLLELIDSNLQKEKFVTITIDAWRYSSAENLRRAFLVHVANALSPNLLSELKRKLYTSEQETRPEGPSKLENPKVISWEFVLSFIKTLLVLGAIFLGFLFIIFAAQTIIVNKGLADFFTKFNWVAFLDKFLDLAFVPFLLTLIDYLRLYVIQRPVTVIQERIDADELFTEYFGKVVDEALKGLRSKKKLIIFVDNLDRLADEKMVEALEGLKTYLVNHHCVFVLACDDNVVRSVVNKSEKIPKLDENHVFNGRAGEHYLDKFFQQTFRLPEFMDINLSDFAIKNFETTELCKELRGQNIDVRNLVSVILPSDVNSPRKVKRLLNEFIALYEIVRRRESEEGGQLKKGLLTENIEFLGKFSTIRAEYPLFYKDLVGETTLLAQITDGFQQQDNKDIQLKSKPSNEKYSESLIDYLRKTQTISVDDIDPYIWLSQDNLALGLRGNHYNLLRRGLSNGDTDQVISMIESSDDLAYKALLAKVASRTVEQRLIGIEQMNGVKVISSLLPVFDDSIQSEIAHISAKLIPLWPIDAFSAEEIFNVLRWARMGGIYTQREKLIARILDRLGDQKLRQSTFLNILKNADVVEQNYATKRVNNWLKDILSDDKQSVRPIGEITDAASSGSDTQNDQNKENRDFAEWLIAHAEEYSGNSFVIRGYFSVDLVDYMIGRLLGSYKDVPAIYLDATEGLGLQIKNVFTLIETEIQNGFGCENYWNGLTEILKGSPHIPEIQYCLEKIELLVSCCPLNLVEVYAESTLIAVQDVFEDPENRKNADESARVLQMAEKVIIALRMQNEKPFDIDRLGQFKDDFTYLMGVTESQDDALSFANSFIERFGEKDSVIFLTSATEAFKQFGGDRKQGITILDMLIRWNEFVINLQKSAVVEKINDIVVSNEFSQVELAYEYLERTIQVKGYKELISKYTHTWKGLLGPDAPQLLQKKLDIYSLMMNAGLLDADDIVKAIIPHIPFSGNQEQLPIILTTVYKFQEAVSEDAGAKFFTVTINNIGPFGPIIPMALKTIARWIEYVDDSLRSQFHTQAYQTFPTAPNEIMGALAIAWKALSDSEIQNQIIHFYSIDMDRESLNTRNESITKALNIIPVEKRASLIRCIWDELINQGYSAEQFMEIAIEFMPGDVLMKLRDDAIAAVRENGASPVSETNLRLLAVTTRRNIRNIMPVVDLFANLFGRGQPDIQMALQFVIPCLKPLDLRSDHKYKLAEAMGQAALRTEVKETNDEIHDKADQLGLMWFSYRKFWK